ncbi:MAG TPA: LuxR C-terminal-related transcriptional regulator [Bryobacteraceae bacterium]|nr:LuxR C-terminal-related transcriptional regulator [Bryobacteraceae bacterium]
MIAPESWMPPLNCRLNERQRDVLYCISKGCRNAEIGALLGLAEQTIKGIVSQLLLIYDVTNRTELVGLLSTQLSVDGTVTNLASQNRHQEILVSTAKPTKPRRRAPRQ